MAVITPQARTTIEAFTHHLLIELPSESFVLQFTFYTPTPDLEHASGWLFITKTRRTRRARRISRVFVTFVIFETS
jgi:hypothetical protein